MFAIICFLVQGRSELSFLNAAFKSSNQELIVDSTQTNSISKSYSSTAQLIAAILEVGSIREHS